MRAPQPVVPRQWQAGIVARHAFGQHAVAAAHPVVHCRRQRIDDVEPALGELDRARGVVLDDAEVDLAEKRRRLGRVRVGRQHRLLALVERRHAVGPAAGARRRQPTAADVVAALLIHQQGDSPERLFVAVIDSSP